MFVFFFNDTATTEIYTLSLHDALPIFRVHHAERAVRERAADLLAVPALDSGADGLERRPVREVGPEVGHVGVLLAGADRKSTRLNSSHANISYAVFCLKKKKLTYTSPT